MPSECFSTMRANLWYGRIRLHLLTAICIGPEFQWKEARR